MEWSSMTLCEPISENSDLFSPDGVGNDEHEGLDKTGRADISVGTIISADCHQVLPVNTRRELEHKCPEQGTDADVKYYVAVKKEIRPIEGFPITPAEVVEAILKKWEARPREKRGKRIREPTVESIKVLVRFFFNVASPEAFEECQEMCEAATQTKDSFHLEQSISKTLAPLDRLEKREDQVSALRRFHLAQLVQLQSRMIEERANRRHDPRMDKLSEDEGGRISSQVLRAMMKSAYPQLKRGGEKYKKRFNRLNNELKHGKNWCALGKEFSHVLLAFIATRGQYRVTNTQ